MIARLVMWFRAFAAWYAMWRDSERTIPPAAPTIADLLRALTETNELLITTCDKLEVTNKRLSQVNLAQLATEAQVNELRGSVTNLRARVETLEAEAAE